MLRAWYPAVLYALTEPTWRWTRRLGHAGCSRSLSGDRRPHLRKVEMTRSLALLHTTSLPSLFSNSSGDRPNTHPQTSLRIPHGTPYRPPTTRVMTLAFPSWSSSHMSKGVGPPPPSSSHTTKKRKPMPHGSTPLPSPAIPPEYAYDHASSSKDAEASSRSSSLAGRKRPRDSDGASARARRTKSVSDTMDGRSPKDREAFQRGLINIFVPNALRESLQGKMANYNDLLAHFLPTPTQPVPPLQPLQPLLKALTMNVSLLSPDHHRALVSAVLGLPWATGEERFVRSFVGWAGVLVSAHPEWTGEVVKMAVKGFRWRTSLQSSRNSS